MPYSNNRTVFSLSALALLIAGAVLYAGPLNPPAGPVTSTYKTLTEVEPRTAINATNTPGDADSLYKITQPGSYYLTGNITGVVGKHGIEISSSGVSLDLSGFDMLGVAGSLDGVNAAPGVMGVAVQNGSIRSWGDEGVEIGNASAATDLRVLGCVGFGVVIAQNSTATRCRVTSNTAGGIATGTNCIVQSCSAQLNGGGGILAFGGCSVLDCTATTNTGNGISTGNGSTISCCAATDSTLAGFSVTTNCAIADCSASFNDVHGFAGGDGVSITNSTAASNFGSGIVVANGGTITSCTARANAGTGLSTSDGCTITDCSAYSNTGIGISTGEECTITGCTANSNSADGILLNRDSRASGCVANSNSGDGIEARSQCMVSGNTCTNNGNATTLGAGVRVLVSSSGLIIDGNTLESNRFGMTVSGTRTLIVRNHCRNNFNGNYDIGVTNNYGPIIDRTASAGAFVSGNSAPSNLTTTDPHANFAY